MNKSFKWLKITILLTVNIFISSSNIQAHTLKKETKSYINKLRSIRGAKIEYTLKLCHRQDDTIKYHLKLCYYASGREAFMFVADLDDGATYIYDEKYIYRFFDKYNAGVIDIDSWHDIHYGMFFRKKAWIRVMDHLFPQPMTNSYSFFDQTLYNKRSKILDQKDTVIGNQSSLIFSYFLPSSGYDKFTSQNTYDTRYKFIFSKSDGFPQKFIVQDSQQYAEYEILDHTLLNQDSVSFADSINDFANKQYLTHYMRVGNNMPLLENNTPAPDWKLPITTSTSNDSIHLYDLKSKVILMDFWYVSCYPCQRAIPELNRLYSKYKDQGLMVIGIDASDSASKIKRFINKSEELAVVGINQNDSEEKANFVKSHRINYPVVNIKGNSDSLIYIKVLTPYRLWGAFPDFYILDKNKKIIYSEDGYNENNNATIESIIEEELKKE